MGVKMQEALQPPPGGAGDDKLRRKPGRKPLQPRNSPAPLPSGDQPKPKPKPKPERIGIGIEISPLFLESDKENCPYPPPSPRAAATPPAKVEQLGASLAEELVAVRKKLERLRADGERTEAMLKERNGFLATKMREVEERGEVQKLLEIEVDRLYRLKQLKLSLERVSPIRSLRERSHINQEPKLENAEESVGECEAPSRSSVSSKSSADED
ncbi:uncharacterized protein J3R85_019924 [Psidium guajava]|nr:uncharacterized protein J3R85_019924 [Psidium guajava]